MKAVILTEGSSTTGDDTSVPARDFFRGSFSTVKAVADELLRFGDVEIQILSEQYGLLSGGESVTDGDAPDSHDALIRRAQESFIESVSAADVVVLMLTKDAFQSLILDNWATVSAAAPPESLWCFCTSRRELKELPVEDLRAKECSVLTYQRVGVARIDNETRDKLVERVSERER